MKVTPRNSNRQLEQDASLQCPKRYGEILCSVGSRARIRDPDERVRLDWETASRPIAYWAPPLAGLLAAGCLSFLRCPVPPSHSLSWASLFGTATAYVLSVFMAGPIAMFAVYAMLPRSAEFDIRDAILR